VTSELAVNDEAGCWWKGALTGSSLLLRAGRPGTSTEDVAGSRPEGPTVLSHSPRDAVAAPMRTATGIGGVLIVCDRAFDKETFGPEDAQVFETLAAHAAVALERAETVDRLEHLVEARAHDALHDPLSGLPNRRAFNDALSAAMSSQQTGRDGRGIVLLLDLDDFKDVNDTLGHSAGDRLITVSGARLQALAQGMVARLGGDEFAVLLPDMDLAQGMGHARELHAALSVPVALGDIDIVVSSSIGLAELGSSAATADELLAQADVAMYTAKADRSGVAVYRAEAGHSTARRLALAADLPAALEAGDIRLWFQPQADACTGTISGFEALMRWCHPVFGWVPPPEIVSVAQRTGRVRSLTNDLLAQALSARAEWLERGFDLTVSVNVTPADIADPLLVTRVRHELVTSGARPEALVLEVTESDAMKDPERTLEVLHALNALGVTLSVDDFGTGHSSLSYLDRLPVKEVKIDQSFIRRVERGDADRTVLSAAVGLAHDLGLRVVAEGVESDVSRALVRDLSVDLYQGYGLARPMAAGDVVPWLGRHAEATAPVHT
jgi:diguanylate cyclase (GGDEF)-like protein